MDTRVKPFDSFSSVYTTLIRVGFYKPLNKTSSCVKIWHGLFRAVVLVIVFCYSLIHIIFILQPSNDSDLRMEALMIVIPQINLFSKLLNLTLHTSSIDKINKLLNDPIFAAIGEEDKKYLAKNVKEAHRLSKTMNIFVAVAAVCWPVSNIVQTIRDDSTVMPVYMPFNMDTIMAKYIVIFLLQIMCSPWVGFGHLALDCLVVTYFAQAQAQLKIIKHNLSHLFDGKVGTNANSLYKDIIDEEEFSDFIHYVKRYEKLVWYTKEVNRVFNPSMTFQFLTSSATLCMVIYEMSKTELSLKFLFLMILIVLLLTQVFLYCYYGNLVRYESESMNTSLYVSEWTCASHRLRRMMLIAMARWSRPLTTQVAAIIPLALDTFISIIKFSYTLYTVLSTRHEIHDSKV